MSAVLLVTFLVYSSVSASVFKMFACEYLDDGKYYLRADYRIECDSHKHRALQYYAGLMVLVYPVGIPLFYSVLLFRHRRVLRDDARREIDISVKAMSNLWTPYRPHRYFYEVIECGRRILLTGAIGFMYTDEVAQVAMSLMIAFIFVLLTEVLRPYQSEWDAWVSRAGHVIVVFSMFLAHLLATDVAAKDDRDQEVLARVLVAGQVCMILAVVGEAVSMACVLREDDNGRQKGFLSFVEEDNMPRRSTRRFFTGQNTGQTVNALSSLEDEQAFTYPIQDRVWNGPVSSFSGNASIPRR